MPHLSLGIAVISTISPCLLHSKELYWNRPDAMLHAKFRALCWRNRKEHKKALAAKDSQNADLQKENELLRTKQKAAWNAFLSQSGGRYDVTEMSWGSRSGHSIAYTEVEGGSLLKENGLGAMLLRRSPELLRPI